MDKEAYARMLSMRRRAVIRIQALYRGHLGRKLAKRKKLEKQRREAAEREGAIGMQCLWRRRFAQRKAECLRSLRIIGDAHKMVLQRAVYGWVEPGAMRCFWYKTKAELDLLYKDYRILVQRTGRRPPLYVVEQNINEVARRVMVLLNMYATRIQARWRGLVGREFLAVFKRQIVRVREIRHAAAYSLQRQFRGWFARKVAKARHIIRWKRSTKSQYLDVKQARLQMRRQQARDEQLKVNYVKEKAEEITTQVTGKCLFAKGAFKKSAYSSDRLDNLMASYLTDRDEQMKNAKKKVWKDDQRARYMREKQSVHPAMKVYYKDDMAKRQAKFIERVTKKLSPFRTAGQFIVEQRALMEQKKAVGKYVYPDAVVAETERRR
jgi:hypothetical protein